MRLLLANIHYKNNKDESQKKMLHLQYPLGLSIIGNVIQKNRNDTLITVDDYVQNYTIKDIIQIVLNEKINCVLLSGFLGNYQYLYFKKVINQLFSLDANIYVIIGGAIASTIPELLIQNIKHPDKKLVCVIGEGEKTIIELLELIERKSENEFHKIKGIAYKEKQKTIITTERERLVNVDDSYPDYKGLFNLEPYISYIKKTNRCWEINASRGCFGKCVYCKLVFGKHISYRSNKSIVNEIEYLYDKWNIKKFNFVDELFISNFERIKEFNSLIKKRGLKIKWRCQTRPDIINEKIISESIKSGLYDISFGIETANQERQNEIKKNLDLFKISKLLKEISSKIDIHATFIFGFPNDTEKDVEMCEKFISDNNIKFPSAGILTLFPKTELYEYAVKNKIIIDENLYCEKLGPVYSRLYTNLTKFSNEILINWINRINNLNPEN